MTAVFKKLRFGVRMIGVADVDIELILIILTKATELLFYHGWTERGSQKAP